MYYNKIPLLVAQVVAFALLAAMQGTAIADPPEPVVRTFGVYLGGTSDPDAVPNFLSDDSTAVIVMPDTLLPANRATITFTSTPFSATTGLPNTPDERLAGTTWVQYPANHTVKGPKGVDRPFVWLHDDGSADPPPLGARPDPPPIGAHTFTGPEGLVIDQQVFQIAPCITADCGGDSTNRWYVAQPGDYFVVVTALFSQ
jgi:hypothetical protein